MNQHPHTPEYVICVHNQGYEASLQRRKLYRRLPDARADTMGMVRVVDEEEEDYLYPADWFIEAGLNSETIRKLEQSCERDDFSRYFDHVPQSEEEWKALIDDFDHDMMDIYRKARSEAGYNPTRYLSMLHEYGGRKTAHLLLEANQVSEGYAALWERGRLDLTVEALIFHNVKYHPLFTPDECERARERLSQYHYTPALAYA